MKIELKGIKTFKGRDGYGMNATMLVDGVLAANVLDEGNGGCYRYDAFGFPGGRKLLEAAKAFAKTVIPPEESVPGEELDALCARLADEVEEDKLFRRLCKTKTLVRTPDGQVHQFKTPWSPAFAKHLKAKILPAGSMFINEKYL